MNQKIQEIKRKLMKFPVMKERYENYKKDNMNDGNNIIVFLALDSELLRYYTYLGKYLDENEPLIFSEKDRIELQRLHDLLCILSNQTYDELNLESVVKIDENPVTQVDKKPIIIKKIEKIMDLIEVFLVKYTKYNKEMNNILIELLCNYDFC